MTYGWLDSMLSQHRRWRNYYHVFRLSHCHVCSAIHSFMHLVTYCSHDISWMVRIIWIKLTGNIH